MGIRAALPLRRTCLLLLAGVVAAPGCSVMSFINPVNEPCGCHEYADGLPQCCRDHVYIFLVHGWDPLDWANMHGVREYCHNLGYPNTYLAQCFHCQEVVNEISDIRRCDPHSRFVIIGYSAGANIARDAAHRVGQRDGIEVALVMYMGGWMLHDACCDRPANAQKVVHVLAMGYDEWWGTPIDGAENIKIADVWHFGSVTHDRVLTAMAQNLADVAVGVPVIETVPAPSADDEKPTPRPVKQTASKKRDEWDFLKPTSRLTPANEQPAEPKTRRARALSARRI